MDNSYGQKYPILQFADDTLLILPADIDQIGYLKSLLQDFTLSAGLKINYHKSSLVPINTSTQKSQELASSFGCKLEALPFTYLGLPMGTTRPRVDDLTPMICKIDRRLSGMANLMYYSARLVAVKSIISAMPNHIMGAMNMPHILIILKRKAGSSFGMGKIFTKVGHVWSNGKKFVYLRNLEVLVCLILSSKIEP
jgi:hypothetical protein